MLGIILLLLTNSQALWAADEAKRVLALIDYIGGDYRNAVQGGKVINSDEYTEMSEFSARSLALFKQLKSAEGDKAGVKKISARWQSILRISRAKTRCLSWRNRSRSA